MSHICHFLPIKQSRKLSRSYVTCLNRELLLTLILYSTYMATIVLTSSKIVFKCPKKHCSELFQGNVSPISVRTQLGVKREFSDTVLHFVQIKVFNFKTKTVCEDQIFQAGTIFQMDTGHLTMTYIILKIFARKQSTSSNLKHFDKKIERLKRYAKTI